MFEFTGMSRSVDPPERARDRRSGSRLKSRFSGPLRVRDTPISEQAILGAAMGAAMTGLKPIAEIMFSDFFAVCFDYIANEFPKSRYMSNGQMKCPLVVRTGNGSLAHQRLGLCWRKFTPKPPRCVYVLPVKKSIVLIIAHSIGALRAALRRKRSGRSGLARKRMAQSLATRDMILPVPMLRCAMPSAKFRGKT